MVRLKAQVCDVNELPASRQASMFGLYRRYYDATSEALFFSDLEQKDHVIILTDSKGRLQGFSTLAVISFLFEDTLHRAIFSGDTIIDEAHWGEQALAFSWIRLAGRIKEQQHRVPLYWFLIVKGHRTYRYLPTFAKDFYPTWKHPTPSRKQDLIDYLATSRFGKDYKPESGLLRFPVSRGHLKQKWASVRGENLKRPAVRFFLERNPGYTKGDELVCLTELHPENLRPLARRLFLQGFEE